MACKSSLAELSSGQIASITNIDLQGPIKQRLLDLGFLPATQIQALFSSPAKNPTAYLIRGTVIALRLQEATQIKIEPIAVKEERTCPNLHLLP